MKNYYISSFTGHSGVSKYAAVFYELVLKPKGYIYIDSHENLTTIFTKISSADHVHFEIGVFQKKEIQILLYMLKANYKNLSVTLHDAPLLKYPFKEFSHPRLNQGSKLFDRLVRRFANGTNLIKSIKTIYVLTDKGLKESQKIYKTNNFRFLPHIVDINAKKAFESKDNRNFLYLGFIGRNKGLEYALKLHAKIIKKYPEIEFYVAGTALGRQKEYYNDLKSRYTKNVHFLGYVYDEDLLRIYDATRFAFLLFNDYRFFYPASGSILNCMNQNKIVLTNPVNTIPETVTNGETGIFLQGKLNQDILLVDSLFANDSLQQRILDNSRDYLEKYHNTEVVSRYFFGHEVEAVSAGNYP